MGIGEKCENLNPAHFYCQIKECASVSTLGAFSKTLIKRHWKTHIKNKDTGMEVCEILNARLEFVNKKGWDSWMMGRKFDDLIKFNRDKFFERLIKLEKGESSKRAMTTVFNYRFNPSKKPTTARTKYDQRRIKIFTIDSNNV